MGQVTGTNRIILLVEDQESAPQGLVSALEQAGRLVRASSLDEALTRIDGNEIGWIIMDAQRLSQTGTVAVSLPAARILDAIDQGACLLKPDGELLWANKLFRSLPAGVIDRVTDSCRVAYLRLAGHKHVRPRRFSIRTEEDQYYDLVATPILDPEGALTQVAGIITIATGGRRLQKKIHAIDQAGRELMQLDTEKFASLDVQQRLQFVEEKVSHYTKDLMHYENFSIHVLDRKTNRLELVLSSGLTAESRELDIYAAPEGNGICGYVAAMGRSYICPNCVDDPRYMFGIESPGSSLTVPLRLRDKVIGVFNLESEKVGAFNEDDRQFAEIFARYLAVALNILDLLVVERSKTTGQLADNVSSEIAGPLNDILSDAGALMEEYVGQDDLRRRLGDIINNAVSIRESIKQVGRPASGVLGKRTTTTKEDPALKGKRILLADDDQIICETIRDVLTQLGCTVETARDGAEAFAMIDQRHYDLVISDIKMPYRNGYEIFAQVKTAQPDCPVMLVTGFGYDPHHSIIRARQEGLSAVLFKPFKIDQLLEEVRRALKVTTGSGSAQDG